MSQFVAGEYTYGKIGIFGESEHNIYTGKFCSIATNVVAFMGVDHRTDVISTYPLNIKWGRKDIKSHPISKGDIRIGNDVWIGKNSILFHGVSIGDGAVIGACSVVRRDVPPYCIFIGNPAQFIKKRFNDEKIEILLELKWWDWKQNIIQEAIDILMSDNIDKLVKFAREKKLYV
ncbi:MAG TPA: CatB-related O-acetyltransferase [Bacteroidales bacterium]|nr:CatB-related O-acetyltransferase [Bacteroidales bacterium]